MINTINVGRIDSYGSLLKFYREDVFEKKERLELNTWKVPNFQVRMPNCDLVSVRLDFKGYNCDDFLITVDCNDLVEIRETGNFISIVYLPDENDFEEFTNIAEFRDIDSTQSNPYTGSAGNIFTLALDDKIDRGYYELTIKTQDFTYVYRSNMFIFNFKEITNYTLITYKHNKDVADTFSDFYQNLVIKNDNFITRAIEINEDKTDKNLLGSDITSNVTADTFASVDFICEKEDVEAIVYLCNAKDKELYLPANGQWYVFQDEYWDVEFEEISDNELRCVLNIRLSNERLVGCSLKEIDYNIVNL